MVTITLGIIPQPKTYGPLGNLPQLDLQQPSQSIMKLSYEYGPFLNLNFQPAQGFLFPLLT